MLSSNQSRPSKCREMYKGSSIKYVKLFFATFDTPLTQWQGRHFPVIYFAASENYTKTTLKSHFYSSTTLSTKKKNMLSSLDTI